VSALGALAAERTVVVCCGSGGVGKTTVSATFALEAARAGRRSCVVTVDPARRLADSLGVQSLPNTPTEVEGDWPGHLHALMLDTRGTFDDLVHRYSSTPEQAQGILANRLYQNLAGALSGTQEYMAMEKLYELVDSGDFDVVVVDTPPTRNALDLLDAPRRLTRFLENRLFRALLLPTRMSLKAVGVATQALLRTISKVAGAEIVQDAVSFFQAFEGMEEGFRNRIHPYFGPRDESAVTTAPSAPGPADGPLAGMEANLAELNAVARREEDAFGGLAAQVAPAAVGKIPLFGHDVHDLVGLQRTADHLFG
jgi:anion-transporting  ArsA/GET3 family ATPase